MMVSAKNSQIAWEHIIEHPIAPMVNVKLLCAAADLARWKPLKHDPLYERPMIGLEVNLVIVGEIIGCFKGHHCSSNVNETLASGNSFCYVEAMKEKGKEKRGFACMSPELVKKICRMGGEAVYAKKGPGHMAKIGRVGGRSK